MGRLRRGITATGGLITSAAAFALGLIAEGCDFFLRCKAPYSLSFAEKLQSNLGMAGRAFSNWLTHISVMVQPSHAMALQNRFGSPRGLWRWRRVFDCAAGTFRPPSARIKARLNSAVRAPPNVVA